MGKDKRTPELRNTASRDLSKLLTTIQRLPAPDALDVLAETLRRCADRAREILLAEDLADIMDLQAHQILTAAEAKQCRLNALTATGLTSRGSTPTSSDSSPPPASPNSSTPAA